jgi:hypothetical protein
MANAPELSADLQVYWQAYEELGTCRGYAGMGGAPLPIPWTAVNEYAIRHRFAGEAFDDLVEIVRAVDTAYLKHVARKVKDGDGEPRGVQQADGEPGD